MKPNDLILRLNIERTGPKGPGNCVIQLNGQGHLQTIRLPKAVQRDVTGHEHGPSSRAAIFCVQHVAHSWDIGTPGIRPENKTLNSQEKFFADAHAARTEGCADDYGNMLR